MAGLTLYYHPFAAFCQKVLIALYETGAPFAPRLIDLGDPAQRAELQALWPVARFPVLRDEQHGLTLPESSIIIEHLDRYYPGPARLLPEDPDRALAVRLSDRFFDHYVAEPMQRIVGDRLRPPGRNDPLGVEAARRLLATAYDIAERDLAGQAAWAVGETFTLADCAAAPALFYADWVQPFAATHPRLARYLARLMERPSFARVVEEAKPYRHLFPQG